MGKIRWVGFDGDDTLWKSEDYYRAAEAAFEAVLSHYIDLSDQRTSAHLLAVERRNLRVFGYGAKGMTLSMIEAAIELTQARISAQHIQRILEIGRATLDHPVELISGMRQAVEHIAATHEIALITKGDLFHQEAKIQHSGLTDLFQRIDIVSEKDTQTYARVVNQLGIHPEQFAMVGNSMRSDIAPVVSLGGWGVHVPYHITWAHEAEHKLAEGHPRMLQITAANELPDALAQIERRAA